MHKPALLSARAFLLPVDLVTDPDEFKRMMNNIPPTEIPIITYVWIYLISMLSAVATYLNRLCLGEKIKHPIITFFKDLTYCLMGGIVTFYLCNATNIGEMQTAAFVSIGSHMGARLVFALEALIFQNKLFKLVNPESVEKTDADK